jgi:hypothetical protein
VAGLAVVGVLACGLGFVSVPALAAAPEEPVTMGATSVTGTSAVFNGELNPGVGSELVKYRFAYSAGGECASGFVVPGEPFPEAEGNNVEVSAPVSGLQPNAEYSVCLIATNALEETAQGTMVSFLTLPNPPAVATGEATGITPRSATINATVNPNAAGHSTQDDTTYQFQYSTDESFTSQTPITDAGEGTSPIPVQASLEGLEPGTTYHYRITATNNNDKTPQQTTGEARTFTTVATPPVLSGAGIGQITQSSAVIAATLDTRGLPTRWALQLATNPEGLQPKAAGNSTSPEAEPIGVQLENLQPGVTYYYRLTAENPNGTADTGILAFTTSPASAVSQVTSPYPGFPLLPVPPNAFPTETGTITATPNPKSLTSAQKLKNALKACRKKHGKRKRTRCEHEARKKYSAGKHH